MRKQEELIRGSAGDAMAILDLEETLFGEGDSQTRYQKTMEHVGHLILRLQGRLGSLQDEIADLRK